MRLVFFVTTGDLAYKKIFPALQGMVKRGHLNVPVIGVAKSGWNLDQFRARALDSLEKHGGVDHTAFEKLSVLLRYVDGDYEDRATFETLAKELKGAQRPTHYLAIPPALFEAVVEQLASSGCAAHGRVIVEKPFGHDLPSAKELNQSVGSCDGRRYHTFAREDYVEEAWRIVDPVLKADTPIYQYETNTWGPDEVERVTPLGGLEQSNDRPWARCSCRRPHSYVPAGAVMKIQIFSDPESVAREAAIMIAAQARSAIAARGRFIMAVSGGHTPWIMLRALGRENLPWDSVQIVQVDERVAPEGDPDRNLTHLRETLLGLTSLRPEQIHAMPVNSPDLNAAAARYAMTLQLIADSPPVLDLVHLGLGPDGHTASLTPGDPVLEVADADVSLTGVYQGRRRMTLTYPILNRSRQVLWLVTGQDKAGMVGRLYAGDSSIPAGRIRNEHALMIADRAAAGLVFSDSKTDKE